VLNCLLRIKRRFEPCKEIFHDSFENFEIIRICTENHARVTGWQKLFFSCKCFQLSVAILQSLLKILRLPNFNMLFLLVLTKFSKHELFSFLPKVDHVIKSCKEPVIEDTTLMSPSSDGTPIYMTL